MLLCRFSLASLRRECRLRQLMLPWAAPGSRLARTRVDEDLLHESHVFLCERALHLTCASDSAQVRAACDGLFRDGLFRAPDASQSQLSHEEQIPRMLRACFGTALCGMERGSRGAAPHRCDGSSSATRRLACMLHHLHNLALRDAPVRRRLKEREVEPAWRGRGQKALTEVRGWLTWTPGTL